VPEPGQEQVLNQIWTELELEPEPEQELGQEQVLNQIWMEQVPEPEPEQVLSRRWGLRSAEGC
jgi:hypothetical protein